MTDQPSLILQNKKLEIRFDPATGRILAVRNRVKDLDLIAAVLDTPPWRIEIEHEDKWLERFERFSYTTETGSDGAAALVLRWDVMAGLSFTSRVSLPLNGDSVFFTLQVENSTHLPVDKVEYPILSGLGLLTEERIPATLVHSQGTGFLFHDPLLTFLPEAGPKQGLRYSPYPEGFNGSTMQFMGYYAEGRGGFYFATRDPGKTMKWFNFYKDIPTAALFASLMHQAEHVAPGLDFAPGYPVEISLLYEGNWYEAAERYKTWAVQQSWTARGPLSERASYCDWLYDDIGLATFGVNAMYDRSAWLNEFHKMAGAPVMHILGPNWANQGQDYQGHLPGGSLSDWLPAKFSSANLEAIQANGDRWVPFEFDLLCTHHGSQPEPVLESRQMLPAKKYSFDHYWFPFMCPATSFWQNFHVQRDTALLKDFNPDGVYYDISANNVLMACRSKMHSHPPGGGQIVADAFAQQIDRTQKSMSDTAGRYVPVGTEMISELLIPSVDFYQARAEASPSSAFEADFWRAWLVAGKVEKIPLFAFVFHEYGPVRMDGWAKLAAEAGDIFYWVASRVTLWGGLFELNYEFSGLETLGGQHDDPAGHYYAFEPRDYAIDTRKAAFVGEVARARAGWANRYLAYGKMLRPPVLDAPKMEMDYFLYNCGRDLPHYGEKGSTRVDSVICAAWTTGGKSAVFFVNLTREEMQVQPLLEPARLGFKDGETLSLTRLEENKTTPLGSISGAQKINISLPPRRIVAVEISRQQA
jgi:hypothetical protein